MTLDTAKHVIQEGLSGNFDTYCFELLAHAMIINIKLTSCHVEFNVTKKNDNKLVGAYFK